MLSDGRMIWVVWLCVLDFHEEMIPLVSIHRGSKFKRGLHSPLDKDPEPGGHQTLSMRHLSPSGPKKPNAEPSPLSHQTYGLYLPIIGTGRSRH